MLNAINYEKNCNKQYKIQLPNTKIAIAEWGNPEGRPVLAIHGWLDNMASFYPLIHHSDWLLQNDIRLISIDLAGHGHSSHRHLTQPYYFLEYIQDLYDIIEYLNLEKLKLLGHSMGAGIACLYAATFPDKVESLMLVEGIGPITHSEEQGPEQLYKSITQRNRHINRDIQYYDDLHLIISARAKINELDEDNVRLLVERSMVKTKLGYHWRSDPRLRLPSALYLTPGQATAFNQKLTMPKILLYGKEGYIHKYPFIKDRIAECSELETCELTGGHHLHMQYPAQVIDALLPFL